MLKDLWRTLLKPDREEHENTDKGEVVKAANILQVGEFQLLQLAYAEWHDRDLPEHEISQLFTRYMLKDEVPSWARHFARRVLEAYAASEIDADHPYFHRFDHDYFGKPAPKEARQLGHLVLIVAIFVMAGLLMTQLSLDGRSLSLFPPFHVEGEFTVERIDGEQ